MNNPSQHSYEHAQHQRDNQTDEDTWQDEDWELENRRMKAEQMLEIERNDNEQMD